MPSLPLHFISSAAASGDFHKPWVIRSSETSSSCAIPPEFNGNGGGFSPEDLFLQALINCFIGTFKVYAQASRLTFASVAVNGTLTVDKDPANQIGMRHCLLDVQIFGVEKPDRIRTLVAKAIKEGFILNSVRTEIEYKLSLLEAPHEHSM